MRLIDTIMPAAPGRMHKITCALDSNGLSITQPATVQGTSPSFWKIGAHLGRYAQYRLASATLSARAQNGYFHALTRSDTSRALVNFQRAWQATHIATACPPENNLLPRAARRCRYLSKHALRHEWNLDLDDAHAVRAFTLAMKASRVVAHTAWLKFNPTMRSVSIKHVSHTASTRLKHHFPKKQ